MPAEVRRRGVHVRRAGLANVGGGDDQSRLHPTARSQPEIRIKLQQARPQKMGCTHSVLAKRESRRARLFRQ